MRNIICPGKTCNSSRSLGLIIFKGWYYRTSDRTYIHKYRCKLCNRNFSSATDSPEFGQKRRDVNMTIVEWYCSTASQRRLAKNLKINLKTVARKIEYMSKVLEQKNERDLANLKSNPLKNVQFDEIETAEHTKCKPLSIALAVDPKTRSILAFDVKAMPAKGLLAKVARSKYGIRADERREGIKNVLYKIRPILVENAEILTDSHIHYPSLIKKTLPKSKHKTVIGGRGSIGGQGELKKLIFDPLFALNHTAAMLRANINRLIRRTWCISKTQKGLREHLTLYQWFHNHRLIKTPDQFSIGEC